MDDPLDLASSAIQPYSPVFVPLNLDDQTAAYAWNNTFNGAKLGMVLRPWADQEQTKRQAAHVKEGRDFFNEEPKPEYYKPYTYPHPLQGAP